MNRLHRKVLLSGEPFKVHPHGQKGPIDGCARVASAGRGVAAVRIPTAAARVPIGHCIIRRILRADIPPFGLRGMHPRPYVKGASKSRPAMAAVRLRVRTESEGSFAGFPQSKMLLDYWFNLRIMQYAFWLAALLAVPALAGCFGGSGDDDRPAGGEDAVEGQDETPGSGASSSDPGTNDTEGTVLPSPALYSCTTLVMRVPVSEETARDAVPDGWEPLPFAGLAYNLVLVGISCDNATVPQETASPAIALTYYDVEPPEEFQNDTATGYRFLTFLAASPQGLQDALNVTHADVSGDFAATAGVGQGSAQISSDLGTLEFDVKGTDSGPYEPFVLRFFTADADGAVRNGFDFDFEAGDGFFLGEADFQASGGDYGLPAQTGPGLGFAYMGTPGVLSLQVAPFRVAGEGSA